MYEPSENNPPKNPKEEDSTRRTMKENIIRMALTSEARQRLTNIKMVKPDIAKIIEEYVIQLAQSGKLRKTIDDEQLKEILASLQERKKEFKIKEDQGCFKKEQADQGKKAEQLGPDMGDHKNEQKRKVQSEAQILAETET